MGWTQLVVLLHITLAGLAHGTVFSWEFGWCWSVQGVFRPLSTGLQQSKETSYVAADFQDGRPALGITYHFCHISLVKIAHRASTDSKTEETYTTSCWGNGKVTMQKSMWEG